MGKRCPFIDPNFDLDVDEPCPVCGMLGLSLPEEEDQCVADAVDVNDDLHQILGEALRASPPREVSSE
jgi:hypothetical protein